MKTFQKLISYVFHPIICPIITSILFFILSPRYVGTEQKRAILMIIFLSTYAIPLVFMFILKRYKMIETFHLKTIKERKFPFVFFITLTFMLGNTLLKTGYIPTLANYFFGSAIALIIAYIFLWITLKISLHTLGFASIIGFLITFSIKFQLNILPIITILFLILGAVAMSRLYLKAHNAKEIYLGVFFGITTQLLFLL